MSWRKGSTASNDTSAGSGASRAGVIAKPAYPFALALRIRVVQIVCGIAEVVMGSVAAIEERQQLNLSLGVPTGAATVLAAAWSVHRSVHRSAGGRRAGAWWSRALWSAACSLQLALLVLAVRTAVTRHHHGEMYTSDTSLALAGIQAGLCVCAMSACALAARVRYVYGSAPAVPPPRSSNCPRSTSHTGVSMVPLTSNYNYPAINDMYNKSADNLSSENEVLEISIGDNRPSSCEPDISPGVKTTISEASAKPKASPQKTVNSKSSGDKELVNANAVKDSTLKIKDSKGENVKFMSIDHKREDGKAQSAECRDRLTENGNSGHETIKPAVI